jgi:hypothetical protein
LGVHLADVGDTLCQGVTWHLVSVLVSELGGFTLGALGKRSGIRNGARDDGAD